ncbi:tripartite tricarboxylate transporter substrate-binding protein [Ramlibacter sp. WS9]|uniref:tripartite tricarboxylate transporter substrate-binding protein n=1 Tax=Ramlibacter sp. WS9 TaxID=1882741 RepID=UPI001141BFE4|nr:tripartite tricarboxylate transporter substrate-binding protein [Ramlibacter sp. WS9]ROZ69614.1 twin-arginine translocation pathway signal protein [Ramlibacter sp. WS9]
MLNRRQFTYLAAGAFAPFAHAQPSLDTARIISGFPPGGTIDVLARRVADKLRGNYAANMLVENKPGAAGQIGILTVKDANPDGSAMLLTPSSMLSIYPYTYPKLQYKLDDVAPVSLGGYINHGIAVGPGVPATVKTLKDFLAWAKANDAKANFGSPGAGSMPHMIGILLGKFTGVDLKHIPYRGTVPGVQDLLGGQISSFCGPTGDYLPHVKTGKLRVLAISGKGRSPFLPETPTLRELGHPLTVREWYGFFLPGKASADVARRAAAYLQPALAHPDLAEFGKQYALDVQSSSASALADLLKADAEEWRRLIKQVGFTAES